MTLRTKSWLLIAMAGFMTAFAAPIFAAVSLNIRVNASSDDATVDSGGTVSLNGATLDLAASPYSGTRYANVTIPQGAYIISAYVTFTANNTDSTSSNLTVYGEAADNSANYSSGGLNRTLTTASVAWNPVANWTSGTTYNTPELNTVVQEIVNRPGWASGNAMTIILASNATSANRKAYSYDGSSTQAPLLHVDYLVLPRPIAKRLLFVVTSTSSPNTYEAQRLAFFQAIGYTVTLIASTATQASYDTAAAANDVAYICEEITSSDVNTKLKSKSLGIVCEEPALCDDFALAGTNNTNETTTTISIAKNNHYITSPFSIGSLAITTSSIGMNTYAGTLASDQSTLAAINGVPTLMAVEIGGKLYDGTTAAGRRVLLPWSQSGINVSLFTDNGYILLSRALAWGGGVVAYWKFDEPSGTTAADSSVNLNNGTYVGGPTLGGVAPSGYGAYFPSDGMYATAPASASLNAVGVSNADFSVVFWVKPAGTNGSWRPLFHKGSIDFERCPGVWLNPGDNRVHFRATTSSNNNDGTDSSTALSTGAWSHVACVKAGNKWRCYINGTLDTEYTLSSGTTGNSGPVYIGDDPWYSGSNSYLDDVRLYNHAIGSDEVTTLKIQGTSQVV